MHLFCSLGSVFLAEFSYFRGAPSRGRDRISEENSVAAESQGKRLSWLHSCLEPKGCYEHLVGSSRVSKEAKSPFFCRFLAVLVQNLQNSQSHGHCGMPSALLQARTLSAGMS